MSTEYVQTRYRTHTCGQLRAGDVGKRVKLAGWAHSYRDHGGLLFIDLRDRDGLTQIVFDADACGAAAMEEARHVRAEWVLCVEGVVAERAAAVVNAKLPTGHIELRVKKFEVLCASPTPPFLPDEHEKINEERRLQYRYIDLRRAEMQQTLRTRQRVTRLMREHLGDMGFWEIETPCLTRSTPEGARDFLVPSRLVPGTFYALPQSPQLFKQILMVAGCDKYMQLVRCFRDEDPRADRQPEFTQLDLEMSFIDRADVIRVTEGVLRHIWKQILGKDVPNPIPHMTYAQAMGEYGSDRPDLRFGMKLHDVTDLGHATDFGVFKSAQQVKAICVPSGGKLTRKETDALAEWAKQYGAKGLAVTKVGAGGLDTGIAKFLAPIAGPLIERLGAREGDLLCFAADVPKTVAKVLGELRLKMAHDLAIAPSTEFAWLWVIDFPLFEYDEAEGRFMAVHHPFTAPLDEHAAMLASGDRKAIETVQAKAYDIVLNGSELGGGSIRIHRTELQQQVFALLGIDAAAQKQKFGFLLEALQYGAPPHGGIALGLERLIMMLRGTHNIRDVIAFPKTQSGADLMCGAPAAIDERQLREANIRIAPPPSAAGKPA